MKYRVTLDIVLHGSSIGSTDDVVQATSAREAESKAIAGWKAMEPALTFQPLVTTAAADDAEVTV